MMKTNGTAADTKKTTTFVFQSAYINFWLSWMYNIIKHDDRKASKQKKKRWWKSKKPYNQITTTTHVIVKLWAITNGGSFSCFDKYLHDLKSTYLKDPTIWLFPFGIENMFDIFIWFIRHAVCGWESVIRKYQYWHHAIAFLCIFP